MTTTNEDNAAPASPTTPATPARPAGDPASGAAATSPAPSPPASTGVTFQRPAIVSILYLLNIVLGFSVLVGVILAYIWRGDERTEGWERTHYTYLIRTFWISAVLFCGTLALWIAVFVATIASDPQGSGDGPPTAFFAGFFAMFGFWLLLAVWYCVRSVLSLVKASERQPMPHPGSLLF